MKLPKNVNKYCPYCREVKEHKVIIVKIVKARTGLVWGARRAREGKKGRGNKGKYSKRPLTQRKRGIIKTSKGVDIRLECNTCKKQSIWKITGRYKKVELSTAIK
ncbi:MAG: 50S ribosomal protein L44e [Candidatus Nanopusillus sp.]